MKRKRWRLITLISATAAIAFLFLRYFDLQKHYDICLRELETKVDGITDAEISFAQEIELFRQLVEESLVARSTILKVYHDIQQRKEDPLTGRDLAILKSGTEWYLNLRSRLYKVAEAYECVAAVPDWVLSQKKIKTSLRSKAAMLSLGAALVLFDNYFSAVAVFEQDDRLRRILNDQDSGFGILPNQLVDIFTAATSVKNRKRVRRMIEFYEKDNRKLQLFPEGRESLASDEDYIYLNMLINGSPSYNFVREYRPVTVVSRYLQLFDSGGQDLVRDVVDGGVDVVSKFFGNTVGMFEARQGKLYGNKAVLAHLQNTLRPLDILAEKTPFRLTDSFIPGHFGHVAIWLGTEQELKELGLWDHPVVTQYHDQLVASDPTSRDGPLVVEALRSGVQLSTLAEFLNVDDVAVLRPESLWNGEGTQPQLDQIREALLLTFRQVGKNYDFNFDVNTTDKIVCSELIYVSFPTISWPTDQVIGRATISPDQVAKLSLNNGPLKVVTFYHDGKLFDGDSCEKKLETLLRASGSIS